MYRHCIYCSADLGANEAVEAFPVGRSLAFDAAKGRLWAVCPRCLRWNLAPIEERWEAVEAAEKEFAGARLRVQRENVGLARTHGGTRLVRVGEALPAEMAAWRYGREMAGRGRWTLPAMFGVAAASVLLVASPLLLGGYSLAAAGGWIGWRSWVLRRAVLRVPAGESPTGRALTIRRFHLAGAVIRADPRGGGTLGIEVPMEDLLAREDPRWFRARGPVVGLHGAAARALIERGLVHANREGGTPWQVKDATELLAASPSAQAFVARTAERAPRLEVDTMHSWQTKDRPLLTIAERLALEMALHEDSERRALEGELPGLLRRWREAEEIASIADRLATAALPGSASLDSPPGIERWDGTRPPLAPERAEEQV